MAQHTPGPWRFDPEKKVVAVDRDGGSSIAKVRQPDDSPSRDQDGNVALAAEWAANGRLLAAAPDLLALAHEYRKVVIYYIKQDEQSGNDEGSKIKSIKLAMVESLIAKAEGR